MRRWRIAGVLLALTAAGSAVVHAQQWTFGVDVADLVWGNLADLPNNGCAAGPVRASPGVGLSVTRRLGPLPLAVTATARVHPLATTALSGPCLGALHSPGTYIVLVGSNPFAERFATTDARFAFAPQVAGLRPAVAVGGGSLWWGSAPVPYGLVAGSLGFTRGQVAMTILGEYQRLGLRFDRIQQVYTTTYQWIPVSQTNLGDTRIWKSAGLLALRLDFKVRTPR